MQLLMLTEIKFIFVCLGHVDVAKLLIENGADVNAPSRTNQNALIDATLCGKIEWCFQYAWMKMI